MAKGKSKAVATEGEPADTATRINHRKPMEARGAMLITSSRPRGKPYQLEEWMTHDRRLRIVKVPDDGDITVYDEVTKVGEPSDMANHA